MGEYHFGVGRGRAKHVQRIDRIARKHGADFVCCNLPGDGWRYWFSGPNRGFPFDGAMARAVEADLEAVGLWPVQVHQ